MPPHEITASILADAAEALATVPAFEAAFSEVRWFGDTVVWLAPEPDDPFRKLTTQLVTHRRIYVRRWSGLSTIDDERSPADRGLASASDNASMDEVAERLTGVNARAAGGTTSSTVTALLIASAIENGNPDLVRRARDSSVLSIPAP